jgi:hypothetical protein
MAATCPGAHARELRLPRARTYARARVIGSTAVATIRMTSFPRCAARLRDGQPCGRAASDGSAFCVHHSKLAVTHGAEVLKQGMPRRRAARTAPEPLIVATDDGSTEERRDGAGAVDPATVRPRLAAAALRGRSTPRTWRRCRDPDVEEARGVVGIRGRSRVTVGLSSVGPLPRLMMIHPFASALSCSRSWRAAARSDSRGPTGESTARPGPGMGD